MIRLLGVPFLRGCDREVQPVWRGLVPAGAGRWFCAAILAVGGLFAGAGCASGGSTPVLDNDIEAFTAGVDAVLQAGMTYKQAEAAIRAKFPPPAINTQMSAPVPTANASQRTYRYIMTWRTFDRGTSLTLTLFCDSKRSLVRWTTGILRENER